MRRAISLALCLSLIAVAVLRGTRVAADRDRNVPVTTQDGVIGSGKLAPEVEATLATLRPGQMTTVIVTLTDQADLSRIPGANRAARLEGVIRVLRARTQTAQRPIQALLAARAGQGLVGDVKPFWIFNGLAVTATESVIRELEGRADVARITPDEISIAPTATEGGPETNLSRINAPALWDQGYEGQGIVVANLDTGVDAAHPDLASSWRGGTNSWFDPFGEHPDTPTDLDGHGTWTMGVMVGGDAGGTAIGVAPGARWIAVRIFDDRGNSTATAIHGGFEWLLDPDGDPATADAPHVVNNSWTFGSPGCDLEFELDLKALRAAEIMPVFSAGNGGPDAETSHSPANNPSALAVGATDDADQIAPFSSRGPASCGEAETIFPELVAPGVTIRTTDLLDTYMDYATGTSVAAPHVAGALALLLSAEPDLTVHQQEASLRHSAVDLGSLGPDNDYGWGRLDVLAAYSWLTGFSQLAVTKHDEPDPVGAGGVLTYTLTVTNAGWSTGGPVTVTDTLPPGLTVGGTAADGWSCVHVEGTVTCTRPTVDTGVAPSITITGTAPTTLGTITNTVVVTSTVADLYPADNAHAEQTSVAPLGSADLSIVKLDEPDPVSVGAALTYTLSIVNAGPAPATAVTVTDTLPVGVTYGDASGAGWHCALLDGTVTCTLPTLEVGVAPSIVIAVTAPAEKGTIHNTATVAAREIDPGQSRNRATAITQVWFPHHVYLPLIRK